jgi:mono/diheme cytochrome c family protein
MKLLGIFVPLGLIAACAMNTMPEPPEGAALFSENCVSCHGVSGAGDGELAHQLIVKPADLTHISARNNGVFPRAKVLSEIDGYSKSARPSREMPEFGAILEGDTVPVEVDGVLTPTPRPLAALMVYLESIQQ